MKKIITIAAIILVEMAAHLAVYSQTIYSKAFGDSDSEPIIFLHGGPGYNSIGFEVSTAQKLADNGFYVIVYDRRGEGRSSDDDAKFTFEETYQDLRSIYKKYGLEKASLIGHSFGGVIGTLYAEKYPKKVKSLVLVAAPLSMQEIFSKIIETSKGIYKDNNDSNNLRYISMLENMDKTSLDYATYSFGHAMQNGFYTPKTPSNAAITIYRELNSDSLYISDGKSMTREAPKGFWENENYTTINLSTNLKRVKGNNTEVYGFYGKEDGLFSENHITMLKNIIPENNFHYIDNCSHNVFIDQQNHFIKSLKNWIIK